MNPMNPIKFDRNAIHMHRISIEIHSMQSTISSKLFRSLLLEFLGVPRAWQNVEFFSGNHAEAWAHGGG